MGAKKLELPNPPEQYLNSNLRPNIDFGSTTGKDLISGNFGGNLSWLNPTINSNNSQLALTAAQGVLQPQFRDTLQQITNAAAANGNLSSSTYTDALARSQSDLNSQYQSIVSQQAINDSNQSNQNRLKLFGAGLDTLQGFTGAAQDDSNFTNDFNLKNYDNIVAKAIQDNQNDRNPGFFGNLLSTFSPIGHDVYSAAGYNVPGMGVQQTALTAASLFAGGGGFSGGGLSGGGGMGNGFGNQNASSFSSPASFSRTGASTPSANFYAMNSSNPEVSDILRSFKFNS